MKVDLVLGIYCICLLILSISSMKTLSTSWSQSTPLDTSSRLFNELLIADENLFESFEKNESFENCWEMFCGGSTTCPIEYWTTTGGEFFWPINGGFFPASSWWKVLSFESLLLVFEDVVFIPAVSGCLPSPFVLLSISLQTPPSSPQPFKPYFCWEYPSILAPMPGQLCGTPNGSKRQSREGTVSYLFRLEINLIINCLNTLGRFCLIVGGLKIWWWVVGLLVVVILVLVLA